MHHLVSLQFLVLLSLVEGFRLFPNKPTVNINGLADVSNIVNPDVIQFPVFELGKWDVDQYTDIIAYHNESIQIYRWEHTLWQFVEGPTVPFPQEFDNPEDIRNLVARDFNWDGLLDIMVTTQRQTSQNGACQVENHIFMQNTVTTLHPALATIKTLDQPLVGNLFGTAHMDLYAQNEQGNRAFWKLTNTGYKEILHDVSIVPELSNNIVSTAATVDLNADCRSDLFVFSWVCDLPCAPDCRQHTASNKMLEFWSSPVEENQPTMLHKPIKIFPGAGAVSLSDLDGDGDIDIVMSVCTEDATSNGKSYCERNLYNYLVIYYNVRSGEACGGCCKDGNKEFSFWEPEDGLFDLLVLKHAQHPQISVQQLDDTAIINNNMQQQFPVRQNPFALPHTLRIGDYTLDAYPDLLLMTSDITDSNSTIQATLWRNTECATGSCIVDDSARQRVFELEDRHTTALSSLDNIAVAFFFVLDEESSPDVVVMTYNNTENETRSVNVNFLYNNYYNDAWFLRVLGLNGPPVDPKTRNKKLPVGVALPGATSKLKWSDLNMKSKQTTGCQLQQSTYLNLDTPYIMYGLGRTNDYVEEYYFGMHVGSRNGSNTVWKMWPGLIPNSQVFVLPNDPADPAKWETKIFISPSTATVYVGIFLASALVLFGIPIAILHGIEKKKDDEERSLNAHHFAF